MSKVAGVVVLARPNMGNSVFLQELHPTKGWRRPYMMPRSYFNGSVVIGKFGWANKRDPITAESGRLMRGRDVQEGSPNKLERHGWYRRQQRKLQLLEAAQ